MKQGTLQSKDFPNLSIKEGGRVYARFHYAVSGGISETYDYLDIESNAIEFQHKNKSITTNVKHLIVPLDSFRNGKQITIALKEIGIRIERPNKIEQKIRLIGNNEIISEANDSRTKKMTLIGFVTLLICIVFYFCADLILNQVVNPIAGAAMIILTWSLFQIIRKEKIK